MTDASGYNEAMPDGVIVWDLLPHVKDENIRGFEVRPHGYAIS